MAEEPPPEEFPEEEAAEALSDEEASDDLSEDETADDDLSEDETADDDPPLTEGFALHDFVFYPQIGHCEVGEVIRDAATGLDLLELTPQDASSDSDARERILVPVGQLRRRGIRHAADTPGVIEEVLGSDFEPTIDDAAERLDLITAQERKGTIASLALALKRLHLRHEMKTINREEEKRRSRIRKWLVVEYMVEKEGTAGQAQSAITRLLGRTMNAVREREKEAAREERKQKRAEALRRAAEKKARRRGRK